MHMNGIKAFGLSFLLTTAVLIPLIFGVYKLSQWQNAEQQPEQVAQSESGVLKDIPKAQHNMDVLVCIAGETPIFGILSLDATTAEVYISALPAEGVLLQGDETPTLAQSYASAGPARVLELLNSTLNLNIEKYIAIPAAQMPDFLSGELATMRVGLSGVLTPTQLESAELSSSVQTFSVEQAQTLLNELALKATERTSAISPETLAAVRTSFWEAWWRDKQQLLPNLLPDTIREFSPSLLTNISATDIFTLEETLEFLANGNARVMPIFIPGDWNYSTKRFEFNDETLLALSEFN